jgi:hypothetical protein
MNLKIARVLLFILSLSLISAALGLAPRPAAALESCTVDDEFEWRKDGCCSDGRTNFRLWRCDGTFWRGTATFKCGSPNC